MPGEGFWCEFLVYAGFFSDVQNCCDNIVCPKLTFFWVFWASRDAETVNSSMLCSTVLLYCRGGWAAMIRVKLSFLSSALYLTRSGLHLILPWLAWTAQVPLWARACFSFCSDFSVFLSLPSASFLLLMYCSGILSSWNMWAECREWCMVVLFLFHAGPSCTSSTLCCNFLFSNQPLVMPFLMGLPILNCYSHI